MRTFLLLFCLGCTVHVVAAQTPRGLTPVEKRPAGPQAAQTPAQNEQPSPSQQATPEQTKTDNPPAPVKQASGPSIQTDGTNVRYYGHSFVYLTSSSGVRVALNPFSDEAGMAYKFPPTLPADIVLISAESTDLNGGQALFGLPQVFRSLTGLGANRANGIPFRGIATFRDDKNGAESGGNTVYVVEMDNLRFCHLGAIGHVLTRSQIQEIGRVDVLFLPVGNLELTNSELWKLAEQTKAKWIVPVAYKTDKSGPLQLRPVQDFDPGAHPLKTLATSDYVFRPSDAPSVPTVLIFKLP
ncbi:MAG: MBL fold metallo-hydrolase [Methylacidiphilales bacterium]|nr:MBL fold metallo-hydrolase [Candidatus Methylacidiphilales bacterium]